MKNSNYKVDIWTTLRYGGYAVIYRKKFNLPFAPFIGLTFIDGDGGDIDNHRTELETNEYQRCEIIWHQYGKHFEINVTHLLKPHMSHWLKETMKEYAKFPSWKRQDTEDVKRLLEVLEIHDKQFKNQIT